MSWSLFGGIAGGLGLFVMNVLAGRLLGPAEYGTAGVAFALGNVAVIAFAGGLDLAATRALARADETVERRALASTATAGVLAISLVGATAFWLLRTRLADLLNLPVSVIELAVPLGVALTFRALFDRMVSGLHRFRHQAIARTSEAVVGLVILLALAALVQPDRWWILPVAIALAAVVVVALYALAMPGLIRPRAISVPSLRELGSFGRWAIIAYATGTILMFGDKLLIGSSIGVSELGIYTAYYMTSMAVTVQLVAVFNNVLMPTVARRVVGPELLRRLDRAALLAVPGGALVIACALPLVLAVYGSAYPLRLDLLACFVAWCALFGLNQVYAVLVAAHSETAYRRDMLFQPIRLACVFGVLVAFARAGELTLLAVLLAQLVAELLEQANLQYILRRWIRVGGRQGDIRA